MARAAIVRRDQGHYKMRDTRDSDSLVSVAGAIVIVAIIAVAIAGAFYLHKRMQRADAAKQRAEHQRAADPAKTLRDAQRMEELNRKRIEEQRAASPGKTP